MEGLLKVGKVLESELGIKYTVNKLLGAGGQGELFRIVGREKRFMVSEWEKLILGGSMIGYLSLVTEEQSQKGMEILK